MEWRRNVQEKQKKCKASKRGIATPYGQNQYIKIKSKKFTPKLVKQWLEILTSTNCDLKCQILLCTKSDVNQLTLLDLKMIKEETK